ncbi:hypothetical protein [Prevotella sp. P6B1]|uniref:hypothetical protein n=1 Tax=Prevotella sp. P6B1 TaxID=1410613 RepID=UPI00051BEF43|nr:hypothetical protein [Prevotella sp. P6B1]
MRFKSYLCNHDTESSHYRGLYAFYGPSDLLQDSGRAIREDTIVAASRRILGQSWGAMQAIAYVIDQQPEGVESLILSSGHASSSLWASEQHRLIKYLSAEDQEAIQRAEFRGCP